ncbi:MAG: hypothetical protein M3150_05950 [Pseudomonadota bacterium]|nr:hypothetical protein [Pseudomonadota bacterium]
MTTPGDKAARRAKAAQLRSRIARLTGASAGAPDSEPETTPSPAAPASPPANPRDFIAQRMRELAAKKKR